MFRFPRLLSPFDVAVLPLVGKDGLPEKAEQVKSTLTGYGLSVFYDCSGSIGRRYRRADEVGIPAAVTIDHDTLKDSTITLRDRDSMEQVRVHYANLPDVLKDFAQGKEIESLGSKVER